jgi:hypothetical protein
VLFGGLTSGLAPLDEGGAGRDGSGRVGAEDACGWRGRSAAAADLPAPGGNGGGRGPSPAAPADNWPGKSSFGRSLKRIGPRAVSGSAFASDFSGLSFAIPPTNQLLSRSRPSPQLIRRLPVKASLYVPSRMSRTSQIPNPQAPCCARRNPAAGASVRLGQNSGWVARFQEHHQRSSSSKPMLGPETIERR